MFKAFDTQVSAEVIILDDLDAHMLEALREKGRADLLHCPVCNQPVLVRAGEVNRPHFAHKHLSDCPSSNEPPELLRARAALYTWLRSKFPDGVTLEKRLEGAELPRGVDCWVEAKGKRFAYWIVAGAIKRPEDRHLLRAAFSQADASLNIVFIAQMMRRGNAPKGVLSLTTTERDLVRPSDYDRIHTRRSWAASGSLHYLDADAQTLTTLRAMACTEPPQQFAGTEVATPLAGLKVSPVNGEFVHPDEPARLDAFRKAEAAQKAEAARRAEAAKKAEAARLEEEERHRRAWAARRQQVRANPAPVFRPGPIRPYPERGQAPPVELAEPEPVPSPVSQERKGTCVYCGRKTRDWWSLDGKTGTCKCKACGFRG